MAECVCLLHGAVCPDQVKWCILWCVVSDCVLERCREECWVPAESELSFTSAPCLSVHRHTVG